MTTPFNVDGAFKLIAQAGADLSASQFRAVKPGATEGQVVAIAAATDRPVGVLKDAQTVIGQPVDAVMFGYVEMEAGAAITYGDELELDAVGRAITSVPTAGVHQIGWAATAAGGIGERFTACINLMAPWED